MMLATDLDYPVPHPAPGVRLADLDYPVPHPAPGVRLADLDYPVPHPAPGVRLADHDVGAAGLTLFAIDMLSAGVSAYHGYKRNADSVGWGAVWFLFGATFPIATPIVALIEGYARPLPPEETSKHGRRLFAGDLYGRRRARIPARFFKHGRRR